MHASSAWLVRHHRPLFFVAIFAAYMTVLFGVAGIRDTGDEARSLVRVATAMVELGMAALLCAGCMRAALRGARVPWLAASLAIALGVAVVYLVQAYSLYVSRNFVTVLAMQNADSVGFVESTLLQVGAVAIVAWAALFFWATWIAAASPRSAHGAAVRWRRSRYVVATAGCGLLFAYLPFIQGSNIRLEAGFRQSPIANLAVNAWRLRNPESWDLGAAAAGPAHAVECFAYPDPGGAYPFLRDHAYRSALPFPRRAGAPGRRPNIIIVFAEGVSARLLGAYGGGHEGLTPQLDGFAGRAMRVDDYFNHTAATFRGLEGQLSSGFSFAGGGGKEGWVVDDRRAVLARIRRQSLPRVVGAAGYESHMFVPHRQARPLIRMLESLGFTKVHTYESLERELLGGEGRTRPGTTGLDDQSLFRGLVAFLERRAAAGNERPFLAATYNIGTHAFLKSSKNDIAYGASGNPVLDKVHNLDAVLGEFLRYFLASPYADDTLLLVTSDHATYPEPAYREAAGPGLKPYFVDRIPLLVHDPFHELPPTFDAQGRNSLGLAPTVLHLAGLQTQSNAFVGRSLFEPRSLPVGIAALGAKYFLTVPEGVYGMDEIPEAYREVFACETDVVRRFYAAERENRLMPPDAP